MRYLFILLILLPQTAGAGAWLMDKDSGRQVIANFNYYKANYAFDKFGQKSAAPKFVKYEFNPYIEYGLLENLTIGGSFAAKKVENSSFGKSKYGIDDINIFTRSYLYQGSILGYEGFVISAEPGLYLPIYTGGADLNEQSGISPSLKFNVGYGTKNYYADFSAGYAYWGGAADKIETAATFGYYLTNDITLMTQGFSTNVLSGDFSNNQDYDLTKAQFSALWEQTEAISHQVGFNYDVAGRNTGAGFGLLYSLWYKF